MASSGETHTDELRAAIRAAWGTSSFELYAMTEAGIIGSHCAEHAGIHLFEDLAVVEVAVRATLRPGAQRDDTAGRIGAQLRAQLASMGVSRPEVDVEVCDSLAGERDGAGKFKLVEASGRRRTVQSG